MVELNAVWDGWQKPIDSLQKKLDKAEQRQLVGSKSRGIERVQQKLGKLKVTLNYICEHHPGLAAGEQSIAMSDAAVQNLMDGACHSGAGQTIKDAQRYLFSGLTRGVKELGWRLSAPAPIMSIQTAPSMFSPEMAARLVDYDALNQQFMATLSDEPGGCARCMEQDAGELLFSMVFHSAVLSKRWFRRVSAAIRAGVVTIDELSWLELERSPGGELVETSQQSGRRIFLAPVTQLLLRRWYVRWGKAWPDVDSEGRKSADEMLLQDYISELSRDLGISSRQSKDVFAMAEANLATVAPGFMVHYARTPDLGASLPLPNWLRLITGQVLATAQGKEVAKESEAETQFISAAKIHDPEYPLSDQRLRFKNLRHALTLFERQLEVIGNQRGLRGSGNGRKKLKDAQGNAFSAISKAGSGPEASVILQLMCHYARFLTCQEGLALSRWREKIRNVALLKPLLDYATDIQSESSLEPDEWHAIYESVIAAHPGNSARLQVTLSNWHEFLHEFYGVERVALDGGLSYGVDAKMVTPREYQQAKQHLVQQTGDEFASIQLALLILGYRCGLRRTEAWFRQLGDFQGLDDPAVTFSELLVRPTTLARVKSDSALRRLPLKILLPPDEQTWMESFLRDRKQRRHNDEPRVPLFADPVSGHFRITERMAFDGLTLLMRTVTGDRDFRFHHLRHSFASITLFQLLERQPFELLPADWFPDEDVQRRSKDDQTLLWKQAGLGDACRGLALLAQWMGHSSERVALRSYTHLLDYLLGWYVKNRINPQLSIDQQAQLLNKSPSALERYRHRNGLADRRTPATRLAKVAGMPVKAHSDLPKMHNAPEHIHLPSGFVRQDVNPVLPYRLELEIQLRQGAPAMSQQKRLCKRLHRS
jgi:integrase